jgi:hypothetical protein
VMIEAGTHVVELPAKAVEKISVPRAVLTATVVTTRGAARAAAAAAGGGPRVAVNATTTEVEESPHLAGEFASGWVLGVCWFLPIYSVLLRQSVVVQI